MKMFKIAMLGLALAVASPIGFTAVNAAESVDLTGVPADKADEIKKLVEASKPTAEKVVDTAKQTVEVVDKVAEVVSTEKITEYKELGNAIGDSVAAAAEKITRVGIDFANSWFGKMAIFMIVWKLLLGSIMASTFKVLLSIAWGSTVILTWKHYFNKLCIVSNEFTRTYKRKNKDTNEYEDIVEQGVEYKGDDADERRFMMVLILAIALIPSAILIIAAF